jgi:mercuric ion transport protein
MKPKLLSVFSSVIAFLSGCLGSCGVVCFASGCCGGALLLGFIGLSGATFGFIKSLTPLFLLITIISLGYAFYMAYKPKETSCCETNTKSECCTVLEKKSFIKSKLFLWIITICCALFWLLPLVLKNNGSTKQADCCIQNVNSNSCCK